jgi:hypothetical protein
MAVKADKWVIAAVAAVQGSKLANMTDPADVALACDFFGFHVASLWISDHAEAYHQGMAEGFEPSTPLTLTEMDHAVEHIAVVMTAHAFRVPTGAFAASQMAA